MALIRLESQETSEQVRAVHSPGFYNAFSCETGPSCLMNAGDSLQHNLDRFFALRQQEDDKLFLARLDRLRDAQTKRLHATHADLFADPRLAAALEFLFTDIYNSTHLAPVAREIRRALPLAVKLLPGNVMLTSANALEAAVLTQELDEALTDLLGDTLDAPLTESDYIAGYRKLGRQPERRRQVELIAAFGEQLERYLRSKLLLGTFKVVKLPAHKAGFSHFYDFMESCFAVMKPVPNAQTLLVELSRREAVIMQKLLDGDPAPFASLS
jgi:hypothetical protein